ncbi:MAG: LamG-like jellyroll fold domain-containing protein, partial [Chitinophagales bacterium]
NVSVATAPGDTALFGDHVWNVYAFNAGDFSDTGHSWNEAYSGYYVDNSLNFNTESKWSSVSSPSNAAGYLGCAVNNDNHSWSAKRKGFPCGTYLIDVPSHDDEAQLFINGVKVWEHIGANDYHANVWTGFLDDNSNVEFRVTEGAGNSFGSITITPQALITVNGPVKFCPGYSVQLTASSAGTYLWSTGETTQTISVNATGNYSVDMTTNGCTNTASQTITVAPLDTAIIYSNKSPDFSFCPSMNTIDLRTLSKPGITRTWSNGSHSIAIFPSVPGNYSLTISDVLGCTATSHVTVTSAVAGVDSSFGDNAWKVNAYSQGYYTEYYGYYTYGRAWFPQDYSGYYLDSTLNFNSEDKWNSDSNPSTAPGYQGCSIDDDYVSWSAKRQGFPCGVYTIDILSHDDDAQLYIDGVIVWEHINGCCDQHFGVWTGALNASSKVEFRVDEMSGDDVGALQFTLQSGNADFISVTGNPIVCTGQSYTLTSALLGTYEWSDGQTTNPAFAIASGSYNVTVTDAAGCALTSNPVSVTIIAALAPVAHINASSNVVCDWNPVTLSSDSTIGNLWSTNETAQSISVSGVNLYTLTVTNSAGCFAESSIQINSGFTPPTPVATVSDTICAGSSATLSAGGLAPGGQVASFNGINQYVIVSQDIPEYDFTIEMWVKTTTANTGIFSVTDGYLGSNGHDRHIFLSNGQLSVRIYPSYSWNSGIQINDGQWHHIALTVQTGIGQKIYVDGIQSNFSNNDDHSD